MTDLLDIPLYDDDLAKLAFRFAHNAIFLALVIRFAWHPGRPGSRDREFAFATVMLNITVFVICFTMKKLDLSLGMALGLFAIFGVLRYRTDAIRTKDMTYLFIAIGLAIVNALTSKQTSYLELLSVNVAIVAAAIVGERLIAGWARGVSADPDSADARSRKQTVEYDRLDLLAPDRLEDLLDDLRHRTHLPIDRVRIVAVDLPDGRATLSVWYPVDSEDVRPPTSS